MRSVLLLLLMTLTAAVSGNAGEPASPEIASMSAGEATLLAGTVLPMVASIRGLEFKKSVPVEVVDDSEARRHFQDRMDRLLPERRMRAEQTVYEHLGLLPAGTDLRALLFELLEEQAGGYYDPETETFYLLGDMPRGIASILMAHELTHALDDQNFGIDGIIDEIIDDENRTDAFGAVVEGSGTLVMSLFLIQEIAAGNLDMSTVLEFQQTEAGRAEKLLKAPLALQRALLGPYILGQAFLMRGDPLGMLAGLNVADLNRAFRDPPTSFEQILHPEKYWDQEKRDDPRPVELPDVAAVLGDGWSLEAEGTLGELDLAILTGAAAVNPSAPEALLPSAWTNDGARGWGGDRWVLLSNGQRAVTLVATLWDSEADAQEFAAEVKLPETVSLALRRDAVVLVGGEPGDRSAPLATAVLDALAPAP